ncbi:MAG: TolC family protein [Pseudomonadales bacterium]|nr:TolC family protein [Pseudomonadales bacterium]
MLIAIQQSGLCSFARLLLSTCCLLVLFPVTSYATLPSLSLDEAIVKTLKRNPQLHQFTLNKGVIMARHRLSGLKPTYNINIDVENFAGIGDTSGFSNTEFTVSLSSIIELGNKRASRLEVSDAELYSHEIQREVVTLDVLGDLTRYFIEVLTTQEESRLALEGVSLVQSLYVMVKNKTDVGAASDAEVMRAKAALAQANIRRSNLQRKLERQKLNLASFWGETDIEFSRVTGSLFTFGEVQSYASLFEQVKASPAMAVLASQVRLKEMEIKLARSQNRADLNWQFGVKRLQESQDSALVFGVSMPLFSEARNRARTDIALAAREQINAQRDGFLIKLNTQLFAAYSQREQAVDVTHQLQRNVIPQLSKALRLTKEAYDHGRLKYQDWITAQQELLSAKKQLIEAASSVLINQALIEQLTAEPLSI